MVWVGRELTAAPSSWAGTPSPGLAAPRVGVKALTAALHFHTHLVFNNFGQIRV